MDYTIAGLDAASATRQMLASEMLSGETITWAGQPETSVIFHKEDWAAIPFSLLWGGFAIFWEYMATGGFGAKGSGGGWFFALWGIPFVVIGQYMIWGRFIYAYYKKRRTYYALTNQRALTLFAGRSRKVTAVSLQAVAAINKYVRGDGIGTITFGNSTSGGSDFVFQSKGSTREQDPAFCDIANVDAVYQMVMNQRRL
jgi:hypothetical protein